MATVRLFAPFSCSDIECTQLFEFVEDVRGFCIGANAVLFRHFLKLAAVEVGDVHFVFLFFSFFQMSNFFFTVIFVYSSGEFNYDSYAFKTKT